MKKTGDLDGLYIDLPAAVTLVHATSVQPLKAVISHQMILKIEGVHHSYCTETRKPKIS